MTEYIITADMLARVIAVAYCEGLRSSNPTQTPEHRVAGDEIEKIMELVRKRVKPEWASHFAQCRPSFISQYNAYGCFHAEEIPKWV